jgi:hypothetical protein
LGRVVLERALVVVRRVVARLPAVDLAERAPVEREPVDRELVDRARRAPPPELDPEVPLLLDPPLLACGMFPPSDELGD